MNKKGFAISGILYSILVLFLVMLVAVLTLFANQKTLMDKTKLQVLNELNSYKEGSGGSSSADIEAIIQLVMPKGSMIAFSGDSAPEGFLLCDGSAVSRTTYAELFSVLGTKYGSGNGSSTFNLPNLKGKTIVGTDSSQTEFNVNGKTGGAKTHTLTVAEMPSHTHTYNGFPNGPADWNSPYRKLVYQNSNNNPYPYQAGIDYTGGSQPHNNLQPYQTANYIIRY